MEKAKRLRRCIPILGLLLLGTLTVSCTSQPKSAEKSGDASRLTGTWVLTSKVVDGQDIPVTSRLMKLVFNNNGTFRAIYRGDEGQGLDRGRNRRLLVHPPSSNFVLGFRTSGDNSR